MTLFVARNRYNEVVKRKPYRPPAPEPAMPPPPTPDQEAWQRMLEQEFYGGQSPAEMAEQYPAPEPPPAPEPVPQPPPSPFNRVPVPLSSGLPYNYTPPEHPSPLIPPPSEASRREMYPEWTRTEPDQEALQSFAEQTAGSAWKSLVERPAQATGESVYGSALRGENILSPRVPQGPFQMAPSMAESAVRAAWADAANAYQYGVPAAFEKKIEREEATPEPYAGYKGAFQAVVDPWNIPLGGAKTGVQAAGRAATAIGRGATEAARAAGPVARAALESQGPRVLRGAERLGAVKGFADEGATGAPMPQGSVSVAHETLSRWATPNAKRAEKIVDDLEKQGIDVTDPRDSLDTYRQAAPEDRGDAWDEFLFSVESLEGPTRRTDVSAAERLAKELAEQRAWVAEEGARVARLPDGPAREFAQSLQQDRIDKLRRLESEAGGTVPPAMKSVVLTQGQQLFAAMPGLGTALMPGPEGETPEERDRRVQSGLAMAFAGLAGRKAWQNPALRAAARKMAADVGPDVLRALEKMGAVKTFAATPPHIPPTPPLGELYTKPSTGGSVPGLTEAWQQTVRAKDAFVRTWTDREVDLNKWQAQMAKAKGAPLTADEMAAELHRLNPDKAAQVYVQEGMRPALLHVGDDRNWLSEYLTYMDNIDVAKAMGERAQREALQKDLPGVATSDLNRARARLRMLKDPADIAETQKDVQRLERKVQRLEKARTTGAVRAGIRAEAERKFSYGINVRDSEDRIKRMEATLGPERMQHVWDAADMVGSFRRQLLQRSVDSGRITQELADQLTTMYPSYVPTRIIDYIKEPTNVARGKSLSIRDNGLRRNTIEGTWREREDPINSMIRLAYETEAGARKNETFNAFIKLRNMDPTMQSVIRDVPDSYTPIRGEVKTSGFIDGKRATYVMPEALETLVKAEPGMVIPGVAGAVWETLMTTFRELATARFPVFLASNALLDAATMALRESVRSGGPQHLPEILVELGKAYADAFQGLLSGTYRGGTAQFLKGGGGMFGFYANTPKAARETVESLSRRHVFEVNGARDILRLTKDLVTLEPVSKIGERVELAPRVASMRLAEKRGANPVRVVINGRTVTIDFAQGGSVSKFVNQFIPFFNVGVQAAAQPVRAFRESPGAFVATIASLLVGPTIAAEAWNRSNPERATDYEDVPQYLKDQGVVIMLPTEAPVDAQGNRRPQFVHIKLREFAPFAVLAREAAGRVMGAEGRDWGDLLVGAGMSASPIQGNNPTDVLSSFVPLGVGTGLQLGFNKDAFRDRMIATKTGDERASALSTAVGEATGIRPSQVEFAVRDLGTGVGGTVAAASDIAAGKERGETPQELPGVGGLYGRFVKGAIGGRLDKARNRLLTSESEGVLKKGRIGWRPGVVGNTIDDMPLRLNEMARYQELANKYTDEAIRTAGKLDNWAKYTVEQREKIVRDLVGFARVRAQADVLKQLGPDERTRRIKEQQALAAAGASR